MMKGGVGLATVRVGPAGRWRGTVTVSALTVVNALGDVLDESGAILAGVRSDGAFADSKDLLLSMSARPAFGASGKHDFVRGDDRRPPGQAPVRDRRPDESRWVRAGRQPRAHAGGR